MTKKEFNKKCLGKAVHCDTEEKAKAFLKLADSVGYKWENGTKLINTITYTVHKEKTAYFVENKGLTYGCTDFSIRNNYEIVEFELEEPKKEYKLKELENENKDKTKTL